jgi:hypothetical protein
MVGKNGQLIFGVPIVFAPPGDFCNPIATICKTEKPPLWVGRGNISPNGGVGINSPDGVVNNRTLYKRTIERGIALANIVPNYRIGEIFAISPIGGEKHDAKFDFAKLSIGHNSNTGKGLGKI